MEKIINTYRLSISNSIFFVLFILLNVVLLTIACPPNIRELPKWQSSSRCQRELSECSLYLNDYLLGKKHFTETKFREYPPKKSTLISMNPNELGIREHISRHDISNAMNFVNPFYLSKKKLHRILYIYSNYIKNSFYDMMNFLMETFMDAATKYGIPEEYQIKCWEECKRGLLADYKIINRYFQMRFNNLTKHKILLGASLHYFLFFHTPCYYNYVRKSANRWTTFLKEKIKNYES
ncbi:RAD protein [Plasmodium ovale]|uniref:RAD protein n=1 Tax=Plasmodium ovale TaxID=36330 RepID=A0A1C3KID3_PLAOA|nr:RAD protein [Plasmodium ovale]